MTEKAAARAKALVILSAAKDLKTSISEDPSASPQDDEGIPACVVHVVIVVFHRKLGVFAP